jgi:hypothetical protein
MNEENTRSNDASGYGSRSEKPLIETDRHRRLSRFALCAVERLGILIESDNLDARMKALDQYCERAGAAADIENSLTRSDRRFIEKSLSRPVAPEQLHERVVERQEPDVSGCREKGSSSL